MTPIKITYQHKTSQHLLFDELRDITWRLSLLHEHLTGCKAYFGLEDICRSLSMAQSILFDDVYKELRSIWEKP